MQYNDKNNISVCATMIRKLILTSLTVLTAACSTSEYRSTYDQCLIQGYDKYPSVLKTMQKECYRDIKVPTGGTECSTTYQEHGELSKTITEHTVCNPVFKTVRESYQCNVEVDTNKSARDLFARSCAENRCLTTFGNRDCKAD